VEDVLSPVLPGKEGMQSCRLACDSDSIDYLLHCCYMYIHDATYRRIVVIIVIIIQDSNLSTLYTVCIMSVENRPR